MKPLRCVICDKELAGRQAKYCSRRCKNADTNRHQSYRAQQARALRRKLELLEMFGGKRQQCGYHRNYAALAWHHVGPHVKGFELDARSLSNRSREALLAEAKKCLPLYANCHAEVHFPHFAKHVVMGRPRQTDRRLRVALSLLDEVHTSSLLRQSPPPYRAHARH